MKGVSNDPSRPNGLDPSLPQSKPVEQNQGSSANSPVTSHTGTGFGASERFELQSTPGVGGVGSGGGVNGAPRLSPRQAIAQQKLHAELEKFARAFADRSDLALSPGAQWAYDPATRTITYPAAELTGNDVRLNMGLVFRELGALRYGRVPEAGVGANMPFYLLWRAIDQVRVNRLVGHQYAGVPQLLETVYARELQFSKSEEEAFRRLPRVQQFASAIVWEWANPGRAHPALKDRAVKKALSETAEAVVSATRLPTDVDLRFNQLPEGRVVGEAQHCLDEVRQNIWPVFERLLAQDLEDVERAAERQEKQQGPQEGEPSQSGASSSQDAGNSSTDAASSEKNGGGSNPGGKSNRQSGGTSEQSSGGSDQVAQNAESSGGSGARGGIGEKPAPELNFGDDARRETDAKGHSTTDAKGQPLKDARGRSLTDGDGQRLSNDRGQLTDADGKPVDDAGHRVDAYGHRTEDARGEPLKDARGRPLVDDNGARLSSKPQWSGDGRSLVDADGEAVNEAGQRVDRGGARKEDDEGKPLTDARGEALVDKYGRRLRDSEGELVDAKGQLVDDAGQRIDEYGHRLEDDAGKPLTDAQGRSLTDAEGNRRADGAGRLIDADGNLVDELGKGLAKSRGKKGGKSKSQPQGESTEVAAGSQESAAHPSAADASPPIDAHPGAANAGPPTDANAPQANELHLDEVPNLDDAPPGTALARARKAFDELLRRAVFEVSSQIEQAKAKPLPRDGEGPVEQGAGGAMAPETWTAQQHGDKAVDVNALVSAAQELLAPAQGMLADHSEYGRIAADKRAVIDKVVSLFQRFFVQVKRRTYSREHYKSGAKLDLKKNLQNRLRAKAGVAADPRIYHKKNVDVPRRPAIVFAIDLSWSMVNFGQDYGRLRPLKEALVVFQEALARLEIPFGIILFDNEVRIPKTVTQATDLSGRKAILPLINPRPEAGTWDLGALQAGANMDWGDANQRLMMFLTDGMGTEGQAKAVRNLERDQRIKTIALGIDEACKNIEDVYPYHMIIRMFERLADDLGDKVLQELMADMRRG